MKTIKPDYIFEASWEVCNRVGGIYTVLSTKAKTLINTYGQDNLIFLGPDVWTKVESPYFLPSKDKKLNIWAKQVEEDTQLKVRVGRWDIPGKPLAILINFDSLYAQKNEIYSDFWNSFGVDSLHAYGDYDESSMFGFACGLVVKHFIDYQRIEDKNNIALFNEWMTAFGALYLKKYAPNVATIFTTHATSIGRSIAGNNKPLYGQFFAYNGDQMAAELNMEAKHSVEKCAAHVCDCFTTVSDITAKECKQLLDKQPDVVTPNGFEDDFVPTDNFNKKRTEARKSLKGIAEKVLGYKLGNDVLFVGTSGRYEFKNKGIDVFIDSMDLIAKSNTKKEIVALLAIPAYTSEYRFSSKQKDSIGEEGKIYATHRLYYEDQDKILNSIKWHQFSNKKEDNLKIIFIPSYLEKNDGIFNKTYYDILIGFDLTVFPSYYEPWGYTPLESVAFGIPTITTDLSGFGQWVSKKTENITTGVGIVHRTDENYHEVAENIAEMVLQFAEKSDAEVEKIRAKASKTAQKALWKNFIKYYEKAFTIALKNNKQNRI
ncbi:MAG: glycogen/starch synthase [Paludibacteraceae bacterium]|nr:glycogen/starch synthase [Paludibacteraceae bacterium]